MNASHRVIGRQHRTARTVLRVGQIAERAAAQIGSIHLDKHPVGAIASKVLRGVASAAPKAAFLASQSENIRESGKEFAAGRKQKDLGKMAMAGLKLGGIGKMAYHTKTASVAAKEKAPVKTLPVDPPPRYSSGLE